MAARRVLLKPMAMACWGDFAPCLFSRTCSISSWTNSPAAVDADFPSRRSSFAASTVDLFGIWHLLAQLIGGMRFDSTIDRKCAFFCRSDQVRAGEERLSG